MHRASVAAESQRTAPPPLATRLYRTLRLRPPRLVRDVAIRVGPNVIETLRTRRLARVADHRDEGDRFIPSCRDTQGGPHSYGPLCRPPHVSRADAIRTEQAAGRAERDLARAEIALARARLDVSLFETDGASDGVSMGREVPVSYGVAWSPCASQPGCPPLVVVYVPGVVRAYVAATGRLVNVLM